MIVLLPVQSLSDDKPTILKTVICLGAGVKRLEQKWHYEVESGEHVTLIH